MERVLINTKMIRRSNIAASLGMIVLSLMPYGCSSTPDVKPADGLQAAAAASKEAEDKLKSQVEKLKDDAKKQKENYDAREKAIIAIHNLESYKSSEENSDLKVMVDKYKKFITNQGFELDKAGELPNVKQVPFEDRERKYLEKIRGLEEDVRTWRGNFKEQEVHTNSWKTDFNAKVLEYRVLRQDYDALRRAAEDLKAQNTQLRNIVYPVTPKNQR